MAKREFSVADEYPYDRRSPVRWIISHGLRYKRFLIGMIVAIAASNVMDSAIPALTGLAFNEVLRPQPSRDQLLLIALAILAAVIGRGVVNAAGHFANEFLGKRMQRDARDELYVNLLGKSQTFHNRQRVGDIMARASNDASQLSDMVVPGFDILFDSFSSLAITLVFIAGINPQLLLSPVLFTIAFLIALRDYMRRLRPVADQMRAQFGTVNAGLAEAVTGIEVVKATAQEEQERRKFEHNARAFRDYFVQNGRIQARYLPTLLIAIAMAGGFLHGVFLLSRGELSLGGLIAYMGLLGLMRFPANISVWTFNVVQNGVAAAGRFLALLKEETDLDENEGGHRAPIRGEIVFDHVTFSYGGTPVLKDVSFRIAPGQTVAIVGQTGAGKSTLTKLVNRIYDVDSGRILVDGVDVRDWSLDALRSQISTIEQDVFLFSRSVAENIAFSLGQRADRAAIERAAHDAQAHDFIMGFKDGYETLIGERGVTLSGGQRQRLAIARALLTDPRILILDDSTSAIDSATEDEIQRAIRRVLQDRTTLLITHRLSQIRWADQILVLRGGALIDQGTHAELLARCDLYRRIFAHYDGAGSRQPSAVSHQDERLDDQAVPVVMAAERSG
ncbi:MAG TPA: ABC transporter ATP-binding protein [Chloroflexia bacterium]|nr:ABC transporter ATP-binding protein [Chloroflexia bacterium]